MRNLKTEVITLSRRPFKDRDRLVSALGKHTGRMTLLARGAQKPGGSLSGFSEPFVYAGVMIARPGEISVVASCDIRESFPGLKTDLASIGAAYEAARLTERISVPGQDSEGLFLTLLSFLYILESKADPAVAGRFFEVGLCRWAGCALNYRRCPCGRPLEDAAYSRTMGYFVCPACAGGNMLLFSRSLLSYVEALSLCPENRVRTLSFPAPARADLKTVLAEHIAYHLDIGPDPFPLPEAFPKS
ncbi:MAG: DNA repair protein RecO [Abditibacteriota bacterium]|nr:DNA repair protein RecO [Abditibacteriota bacterium]